MQLTEKVTMKDLEGLKILMPEEDSEQYQVTVKPETMKLIIY